MKKLKKIVSAPILSVILVVGFVYYLTIFVAIDEWLGLQSSAGSLNALIFTYLAAFALFSFFVCVFTDPGSVPPSYVPDLEETDLSNRDPNKTGLHLRHCDRCAAYKPPRAHHCRVCRRCVLKMDHHCLWINNCVGHRNYKAFVVLVLYATLVTMYSSVLIGGFAIQKDWIIGRGDPRKIFYITCLTLIVGLSLTLGTLLGWHIYLVMYNMTTIEYYEGKRVAWLARKSGQSYRHPFDVGCYKNITLILGPNMLKWLWPTATSHIKDGIGFPMGRDSSS